MPRFCTEKHYLILITTHVSETFLCPSTHQPFEAQSYKDLFKVTQWFRVKLSLEFLFPKRLAFFFFVSLCPSVSVSFSLPFIYSMVSDRSEWICLGELCLWWVPHFPFIFFPFLVSISFIPTVTFTGSKSQNVDPEPESSLLLGTRKICKFLDLPQIYSIRRARNPSPEICVVKPSGYCDGLIVENYFSMTLYSDSDWLPSYSLEFPAEQNSHLSMWRMWSSLQKEELNMAYFGPNLEYLHFNGKFWVPNTEWMHSTNQQKEGKRQRRRQSKTFQ